MITLQVVCNKIERMIFIVIQEAKLNHLIKAYWDMYETHKDFSYVVKPSMPILYFGNSKKYFESPIRIITVGLSPSKRDFPKTDPFQRFQSMKQDHYYHFDQQYIDALEHYFEENPYKDWYNSSFEYLLNGLDASFYAGKENMALHTDICSPLAIHPTWDDLGKNVQIELQTKGVQLWHQLVDYLQPDIIFISVAGEHLGKIQFESVSDWETIYTLQKDRPYLINSKKVKLSNNKRTTIYFGRAAELPFGLVSNENKKNIGRQIKALMGKSKDKSTIVPFLPEQNDGEIFNWNEEAQ
ncbi:hypothetical protein ACTXGU_13270 [Niallia sp. 01092]|uniref:hypothetical protein n=1 Tax=Niallia sp. 01092 TaxID=3457759 RepID=UPI003FD001E7